MIHDPINDTAILRTSRDVPVRRRRLIGGREIILVMLAFALLAIVPSVAQIAPFSGKDQISSSAPVNWDAEYPAENFPGSAFFYLDPSDAGRAAVPEFASPQADAFGDDAILPSSDLRNSTGAARPFVVRAGSVVRFARVEVVLQAPEQVVGRVGVQQAFLILGAMTILSSVVFMELRKDDGDSISHHAPISRDTHDGET